VRRLSFLAVAFALAGCGSAVDGTGVPASSGPDTQPAETMSGRTATLGEAMMKPPPILLVSETGKQTAVQGSYCITYDNPASSVDQGLCLDSAMVRPDTITVVHPGDRATILVPDSTLKEERIVTVRPLGCVGRETKMLRFPVTGQLHWQVDLDAGAYQLDVFVQFETDDGRSGDVLGTLGLLVGETDKRQIVPADAGLDVCPLVD